MLLLANPNYFGNLELSPYKPVKSLQSVKTYEELVCVGLNPPYDRLEAVLHVKRESGYGGDICSHGSFEYVRFYVDIHDNGVWHDVGLSSVRVHDIPGEKPLCYAVRKDFAAFKKLCTTENIVKVRAILSWDSPPPTGQPNWTPVYGNVLTVQVQIRPWHSIFVGDLVKQFVDLQVHIPDPIGPVIAGLDPTVKLKAAPLETLTLARKKALYADKGVPVHRFGFVEADKLLAAKTATSALITPSGDSPLASLGLSMSEIADLFGKLQVVTDGDTSYEELRCAGLRPQSDLLEAVLTIKKPYGYSGGLCTAGSTEYVAFWIDAGSGFIYAGTATVSVHDLTTIPPGGVQYAVFLKTDFSQYLVPCEAGARVVRLRAILSWGTPPPPTNPGYVPTWGNREECLIQLRPGAMVARNPVVETVGDISIDDISPATGLATGDAVLAAFSVTASPFGGTIAITGRIAGTLPDSYGGPALPLKYRILVRRDDGVDTWHPLTNTFELKTTRFKDGGATQEEESPGDTIFNIPLTPSDDGDGLGEGWYEYLEDHTQPKTQFLAEDILAKWLTNASMEGEWELRMEAKDPNVSPPTLYPGVQVIRVRVDNTAPSSVPVANPALLPYAPVTLTITGATFNGNPVPAIDCGKFPVGTILTGTYEVHDPGSSDLVNQHFGSVSLDAIPDGPAHGATVMLSGDGGATYTFATHRSFPVVPTTGESGHWRLNTGDMGAPNPPASPMAPCGYVIRLRACDRANHDSRGVISVCCRVADIGFCLEEAGP